MFERQAWWLIVALMVFVPVALGVARPTAGAGAETRYLVRPGDTLWEIADRRYDGDPREGVWRIRDRNGLGSPTIAPGTVLVLPP
jgi:nucleoid-associated protein YgaU